MGQVPVEIGVEGLARTDELDPRSPAGGEVYDVSVDGVIAGQIRKREVELYDGSARGQPIADQARRLSRINTNSPRPPGWIRGLEHVRDGGALNDLSTAFLIFDYASTAALPRVLPARLSLWEATLSRPVRKEGAAVRRPLASRGPFGPEGYLGTAEHVLVQEDCRQGSWSGTAELAAIAEQKIIEVLRPLIAACSFVSPHLLTCGPCTGCSTPTSPLRTTSRAR